MRKGYLRLTGGVSMGQHFMSKQNVDDALKELHELDPRAYWRVTEKAFSMFEGYAPNLKFTPRHETEIVYTPFACGTNDQRIFSGSTLADCMNKARAYKQSQRGTL